MSSKPYQHSQVNAEKSKVEEEMLNAFKNMEMTETETEAGAELGLASFKTALKLHQQGHDPEKALDFALKALNAFHTQLNINNDIPQASLRLVEALHLVGSIHLTLNRFHDGLGYLNRANTMLSKFQDQGITVDANVFHSVQFQLLQAHMALFNYKEALPFSLKVLEIHQKWWGPDSEVIGMDRKLLGQILSNLKEHEKALEQTVLAQRIFKNWKLQSDLLPGEIDVADMMIELGRYDEAVGALKNIVQWADEDSETQALALMSMAKGFCNQKKFRECKRYLKISLRILEKRELISPEEIAQKYIEISTRYETMEEFETAISLLKRTLALLEKLPQEPCSLGRVFAGIGKLLWLTGKEQQAIPYLESAAERLKYSFGPNHLRVAAVYNNLGAVYLKLGRPESAAEVFAVAKDIMDVCFGPHHSMTIGSIQNLAKAYGEMRSYGPAIELQQQVVNAWENHGASAENLREAKLILEELKKKSPGFYANESTMKTFD